ERLIRKALDLDAQQRKSAIAADLEDDSDNAAFVDSLGWVLFRRGQLDAARENLEKAAALSGGAEDPVVWDHLGAVSFRMHDAARAKTMWEKSLALYETTGRRKTDGHYAEVKRKLHLADSESQHP